MKQIENGNFHGVISGDEYAFVSIKTNSGWITKQIPLEETCHLAQGERVICQPEKTVGKIEHIDLVKVIRHQGCLVEEKIPFF